MSENKFTPGPWFHGPFGQSTDHFQVGLEISRLDGMVTGCRGDEYMSVSGLCKEADARLIAAAPDLLEACQKALYALKGREHDGFLRAAIAKARGLS